MSSVGFDKSGRRFACRPYSQTISAKDFVADKYVDEESEKVDNKEQKVEKTSKPLSENPQKAIKNTVKKVEIPKNEQINIDTPVEPVQEKATDIPMLSLILAEKSEEEQQEQEDEEVPIIEQQVEEEPIVQEEKEPVVEQKEESAPLSQSNTDDDLFDLSTLIVENTDALIKSAEREQEQEQEKRAYEYPKEIINEPIENIEDERDLPLRKEYTETEYQEGYDPEYDEYPEDYYEEEDERYSDEYYEDEEDYDEEDEEEERGPLTVKDYKLIYYYRTMTLIIILLVILLICVIYMSINDITIADLIPDKVKAILSSRYFKKLISLIQGMM